MEFAKPQKLTARVADKYYVSENKRFMYVKFELVEPNKLSFLAGQYVSFLINETGTRRSYSIVSTPDDDHGFHILAEIIEGGMGSEFLQKIDLGDEVEVLGPLGRFVVKIPTSQHPNKSTGNKLLFVATGAGIVPIWSMINDLLISKKETRPVRLHWGMRSEKDLFFVDNMARLAEIYPNFVHDIVLSKASEDWSLCGGYVQDCLKRDFSPQAQQGLVGWEAYVCGREDKVSEIVEQLVGMGILPENIYREKFV